MAQNVEATWKQLDALWRSTATKTLPTKNRRYVLVSDTHFGNGGKADDFYLNQESLLRAFDYYEREGFTLVLLGDIEELWQFDLADIVSIYRDTVYKKIQAFGDERVIRIFGNHDLEWGGLLDPARNTPLRDCFALEAVKLLDGEGDARILVVHGHQGSLESDTYIWFSRFWVRLYTIIEPALRAVRLIRSPSATKSQIAKNFERVHYTWAKRHQAIIICGHSHRAIFAAKSHAERLEDAIAADRIRYESEDLSDQEKRNLIESLDKNQHRLAEEKRKGRIIDPIEPDTKPLPCYFNTGCGLYSEGATAIEIDDDSMRLVKWSKTPSSGSPREIFHEGSIRQFVEELKQSPKNGT